MTLKQRYAGVLGWFRERRPDAQSELVFRNPYELTVAVILSAQCTDRRVNLTTPELFMRYPDVQSLSAADPEDVQEIISSVTYPKSKAAHLIGMACKVVADFEGEIPSAVDDLMSLPGVGRKTANVVSSIVYGAPVVAVDTHVFRVSHRLGLSDGKTPEAVEADLERHIPIPDRAQSHHWLILHGRYVCTARSPKCGECGLRQWCRHYIDNTNIKQ